eukprot:6194129-Pleurochrysis_carterae.AAC.1
MRLAAYCSYSALEFCPLLNRQFVPWEATIARLQTKLLQNVTPEHPRVQCCEGAVAVRTVLQRRALILHSSR